MNKVQRWPQLPLQLSQKAETSKHNHLDDQLTTGKIWDEWLEEIEREFRFFRITEPVDKKDALLIYGGKVISRLEKNLPNPMGELNEYEKLKRKLNDYFMP